MEEKLFTILVVDDEELLRNMLQKWLEGSGYRVLTADNGEKAWETLEQKGTQISLLVTDVQMPKLGGFGLVEKIIKEGRPKELPVIFMSAEETNSLAADKAIQQGSHDYLFKPLIRSVFLKKVQTIFENIQSKKMMKEQKENLEKKEKALEQKEQEIGNLKKQLVEVMQLRKAALEAIETPIQEITRTVSTLLLEESFKKMPAIQDKLHQMLFAISKQNLYKPALEKLIANKELDSVTKSYLITEISGGTGSHQIESLVPTVSFPNLTLSFPFDQQLQSWEFDVFSLSEEQMLFYLKQLFLHFDLLNVFKIDEKKLELFLLVVKQNYFSNPYHNFTHAFDVTQTIFSMLTSMNLASSLSHLDLLALLISGLCHDLQHPGLNNAHHAITLSELAIKYNDKSILENHHCYMTFRLLLDHGILSNLSKPDFLELRKTVIACVLATDMAAHFEFISKLESRIESGKKWNREERDDRLLLSQLLLKVADISNVAKVWNCSYNWTQALSKEFFAQGDLEKSKNIEVAPFLDREKSSMFKNTCNFIDFVVIPFFRSVSKSLPSTIKIFECAQQNREKWMQLQLEFEEKLKQTEPKN